MDKSEFVVLALGMRAVYTKNNFLPDDDAINVWYALLKDIPYEILNIAIQKYMQKEKFPPTVAELREIASEIVNGETKDWSDGWEQVLSAIRKYGMYRETEAIESMDEITQMCVKRLGFQNICTSDNIAADRANFRQIYQTYVERQKIDNQISLSIKNKIAQIENSKQDHLLKEKI